MANSEENSFDDNKIKESLMGEELSNEESNNYESENNKTESDEIRSIKNDLDLIDNNNNNESQNEENNILNKSNATSKKNSKTINSINESLSMIDDLEKNSNNHSQNNNNISNSINSNNNKINHNISNNNNYQINSKTNLFLNIKEEDFIFKNFIKIQNCSILKYGIKPSSEKIKYGFCSTCDINLIHPICSICLKECHKKYKHQTKLMDEEDNIKCGCGERLHKFPLKDKKTDINSSIECPYIDWCDKTGLSNLYVINDNICVCEFCYRLCGHFGLGIPLEKEKEMLQICECEELNNGYSHIDLKQIYRKFEELIKSSQYYIMGIIEPLKFFNILFLGKHSYKSLFFNFEEVVNEFNHLNEYSGYEIKENFLVTNFFLSLRNFNLICGRIKGIPLRYYCNEAINKITFKTIYNIFKYIKYKDNPIMWKFYENILFFFRKVSLGNSTNKMSKFKLYDIENFSPIQRKCIIKDNKNIYPESTDHINFFIEVITFMLNSEIIYIDAYDTLIQICSILKRYSIFFFFFTAEMTKFCFSLEKGFEFFKREENIEKQIKLFLIVIKMIHYFIYTYNDKIFFRYIESEGKGDKGKTISSNSIPFLFVKNELGRLICRNVIRITYSILIIRTPNTNLDKNDSKRCKKIINHGMKILTFLVGPVDNYCISLNKFQSNCNNYLNIFKLTINNNPTYKTIVEHCDFLENNYISYYSTQIDDNELFIEVSKSLENIIEKAKGTEIKHYLFKSQYYFIISKFFYIFQFDENNEEHKNFISNYLTFLRYFIENNSDNAFLIFSHFILRAIILRIPKIFALDILRIFEYAADIICKKDEIISNSKHIIKTLFQYIFLFKENFNNNEINNDNNTLLSNETFSDDLLHLFLMILSKLVFQTKHHYPKLIKRVCRDLLFSLIPILNLSTISSDNLCIILIFINKLFDPSDGRDRKTVLDSINSNIFLKDLKDINIDLDYRTEILRFFKKYKYTLFFRQSDLGNNSSMIFEENFKKKKTGRVKRRSFKLSGTSFGNDLNLIKLFTNHEIQGYQSYEYINAFGQNEDNYIHIKNNPLVSNYKFPTRYLTFYYYLYKKEYCDDDDNLNELEEGIQLWEKELGIIKDIYEKNTNHLLKFFRYIIKGIIIPLSAIIKNLFCYAHNCGGNKMLRVYQVLMKLLYVKNYIIEFSNSLYFEKNIKFKGFDIENFLSEKSQNETYRDYFDLKDGNKFSPFDYTELFDIFDRNFLHYIRNPKTLDMIEKFSNYDVENSFFVNIKNELEILSVPCEINKKKKTGLLVKKKDILKKIDNFLPNKPNHQSQLTEQNLLENQNEELVNIEYDDSPNEYLIQIFKIYKESKNDIDKNSSFFLSLNEICAEFEVNFRRLFLCILINLSLKEEEYQNQCYLILYKLLKIETTETQNSIMENLGGKQSKELGFLKYLNNQFYSLIVKFFISDFNIEYEHCETHQILIFNIVKIFKWLCEFHSSFFQQIFLRQIEYDFLKNSKCKMNLTLRNKFLSKEENKEGVNKNNEVMTLISFLVNILHKIILITRKAKNEPHIEYYYDIQFCIVELLVELIQGNKEDILIIENDKTKKDEFINSNTLFSFHNFVHIVTDILFDDYLISHFGFKTKLLLMSLFISILEQKRNEEIQKIIMKFLTINRVLSSIIFTLKKYFYQMTKDDIKYSEYYSNYNEKQIEQNLFVFDYTVYEFFKNEYFDEEMPKKSDEFKLANNYYRYIKLLSIKNMSPDAEEMIKQVEKISEEESKRKFNLFNKTLKNTNEIAPINLINEKERIINTEFIEHYFCIKFFEIITKVIEVRLAQEKRNQKIIFTVPSEIKYLSDMTKEEFLLTVDRTNETSKKSDLVKNIILFKEEINYFKNTRVNQLQKFIINLDYYYVQLIIYFIALFFLIFMISTLKGYTNTIPNETRRLRHLIQIKQEFQNAIDNSIYHWGHIYDKCIYFFCALNGILIISWIYVKLPLYYNLDKVKYCDENKISLDQLTIWNKIFIIIVNSMINRNYINSLLIMFILSFIGSVMNRGELIYAFFLLAIISLNSTLKGIAVSIELQKSEIGATFLLMIVLVYFYTNIGFFFFNSNFQKEIEEGYDDNFCSSLIFCFLTNIDAGIRARGGAADQMVRISYMRNNINYATRIIYDVTYFLICIIVMIDLIFGIILGTFSQMREQERKKEIDRVNHCFICHDTRANVEKKDEDFTKHRESKHNLWNYVNYMLYLEFTPFYSLNAINNYARVNLDEKNIGFLPSCQDNFEDHVEENDLKEGERDYVEEEEESEDSNEFAEKDEEYEDDEDEEVKKDDLENLLIEDKKEEKKEKVKIDNEKK